MMGYDIREVLPEVFRIPVPLEGNPLKELKRSLRDWGSLVYPWRIRISC